ILSCCKWHANKMLMVLMMEAGAQQHLKRFSASCSTCIVQLSFWIAGGPGSGKGTQSNRIASHFGFTCISVGEILRKQMIHHANSDRKWELIAKIIANGELAPPVRMIGFQNFSNQGCFKTFRGGFKVKETLGKPLPVIAEDTELDGPKWRNIEEKRKRRETLGTRMKPVSICSGRLDDNPHAIGRRLETFKQNVPLIVNMHKMHILMKIMDTIHYTREDFFAEMFY
uniref:Uncharacterized protein n=1 Tax=Podarcis muralis TaxID=64176 RepID=A0A670JMD9_PODMU